MTTPSSGDLVPNTSRLDHGKHEVENECLTSGLWKGLPEHLIDEILAKLPFSSLVRFCSVCKRWRHLILSSDISPRCTFDHGRLFYFSNDGELNIFSSSRGTWEIAPLGFLEEEFDPIYDLVDVVASAGGLLCFCTSEYGEFVVCNPITKCYKRLQMPCGEALTSNGHPGMPRKFPEGWDDQESLELLVGMVLDPDSGHFQIIVGGIYLRGTALLYESSCNSWKKVASIPAGANLSKSRPICCGKNIFFFFVQRSFNGARILKYDSEEQSWRWIRIREQEGFTSTIVECRGNLVLMTGASEKLGMVEYFVLHDSGGRVQWLRCRSENFNRISDSFPDISLSDYFYQGHVLFLILKRTSGSPGFETGEVLVAYHNTTIGLVGFSDWEDSGYKVDEFPECQIFKPSLMPIM